MEWQRIWNTQVEDGGCLSPRDDSFQADEPIRHRMVCIEGGLDPLGDHKKKVRGWLVKQKESIRDKFHH